MQTFREWLIEKEQIEEQKINEIFNYVTNYKEVSKDVYLEYYKKMITKDDPNALSRYLDVNAQQQRNHGTMVQYYLYKDFLIYYGKFKKSKKYEVHFWNITTLEQSSLGGDGNFSSVFSAVMSIIMDKHIDKGRVENVYIKHDEPDKVSFYEKIIQKMLEKSKLDWSIHFDSRGLYISKNKYAVDLLNKQE